MNLKTILTHELTAEIARRIAAHVSEQDAKQEGALSIVTYSYLDELVKATEEALAAKFKD